MIVSVSYHICRRGFLPSKSCTPIYSAPRLRLIQSINYASLFSPTWYHEIRVSDSELNLPLPLLAPLPSARRRSSPRHPSRAPPRRPPSAPPGRSPMISARGRALPICAVDRIDPHRRNIYSNSMYNLYSLGGSKHAFFLELWTC